MQLSAGIQDHDSGGCSWVPGPAALARDDTRSETWHRATADDRIRAQPSPPRRTLVVGASGGIGGAFAARLTAAGLEVHAAARRPAAGGIALDLTDEAGIEAACAALPGTPPLRLAVVATGLLHDAEMRPEKSLRALDAENLARSFAINTIGPALIAKHVLPRLPRDGKSVFAVLSARVGSISDNRLGGWHGYRASKAALNQIVRTLAIELRRSRPEAIVVALHPGTVATGLSAPFRGNVEAGKLFTPDDAAGKLLAVVDGLTPEQSGRFFGWDEREIQP